MSDQKIIYINKWISQEYTVFENIKRCSNWQVFPNHQIFLNIS